MDIVHGSELKKIMELTFKQLIMELTFKQGQKLIHFDSARLPLGRACGARSNNE